MSTNLKPWMKATFELIVHAEIHLREGGDFDRRIAHIGFDNAIEVAITTYLGLNPIQRGGKSYKREDVEKWLANYHTKIEFLEKESQVRGYQLKIPNDELVYYHDIRNGQYHTGGPGIPESEDLNALRQAALDAFAMLFEIGDVDQLLQEWLVQRAGKPDDVRPRNPTVDRLLDLQVGGEPVDIFGSLYSVGEALYATDPESYHAVVTAVVESRNLMDELSKKYPKYLRPELTHVGFVHFEQLVYLKTLNTSGEIELINTDFISGGSDGQFFSPLNTPDENAALLVNDFSPYSIINCFEIFTQQASRKISRDFEANRSKQLLGQESGGQAII